MPRKEKFEKKKHQWVSALLLGRIFALNWVQICKKVEKWWLFVQFFFRKLPENEDDQRISNLNCSWRRKIRKINYRISWLLYESRRKSGWRFTAGSSFLRLTDSLQFVKFKGCEIFRRCIFQEYKARPNPCVEPAVRVHEKLKRWCFFLFFKYLEITRNSCWPKNN